jgi:hypothetical protein
LGAEFADNSAVNRRTFMIWVLGAVSFGCVGDSAVTQDSGSDASVEAASEAGVDAAPEAACTKTLVVASSEADTQILSSAPTQRWGTEDIMGARNDLGGTMAALMRFDVTGVPTTAQIVSIELDLPWAKTASNACGATCASCSGIDVAGMVDVYYMRSDWPEADASWAYLDETKQIAWGQAGASGNGTDRTPAPIGSFSHALGSDLAATLPAVDLFSTWRQGDKISFQVVAQSSTKFLVWTKDNKGCSGQTAPKLTVGFCP